MTLALKSAVGYGGGTLVGMIVAFLLTSGMRASGAWEEGSGMVGLMNLIGLGVGGFVAGSIGGAALGRGWRPVVGYGLAFVPLFYFTALSMMVFL